MTEPFDNYPLSNGGDSEGDEERFILRLFVAGASANSVKAIANVKQVCETHLAGRYTLEIIDVHQQKGLTGHEQLIALPLLIKYSPHPRRRLIGDMSDTQQVLHGLGL